MGRISEVTKRDIFNAFKKGINVYVLWDTQTVAYPYFSRLEECDFFCIYKMV